ncbi:glycosyltransferase family 2 protein [Polaribacter litorisediminis]|uniref:glycosyltransferase family 2 protein n=1 Tax=Polaribacter litorisediminis TaxID=1908341 RepID=UPI001CBE831C|nr:glycosyltransferase family 2 protein [Polaribacter litorisediminis]UAM97191.1 glycosyltransferase family 2 protein [Polaribacter litorisediminis]
MKEPLLTASLVVYHNAKEDIKKVIDSFLGYGSKSVLFIIDNSANDSLKVLCDNSRVVYVFNDKNIGFGAAHNIAFNKAYQLESEYHILLNPDVYFKPSIIKDLIHKAASDLSIGLLMPKVIYPNGNTQHLCKLIPSPKDLILRRFIPFKGMKKRLENRYELRFFSYDEEAEIPVLSGCFMMIRTSILKTVNGFDDRFFMYLEDVDLCRRVSGVSRLVYYPKVSIVHNYEKGSYKSKKLLSYHIQSAIKYFNKWGWFFDAERSKINHKTLLKLNYKK